METIVSLKYFVSYCNLILFISLIWIKGEGVVFRKRLMRKCMDIPSVLFSISEAALKRRPRATEAEIK